jgi:hypothetical protein
MTWQKRSTGIYRAVPVPLEALDLGHGIRELQGRRGKGRGTGSGPGAVCQAGAPCTLSWRTPVWTGLTPRRKGCGTGSGWLRSPPG